ncbi:MAG: flagellar biosynthetic protein FliR [Planctomycetota bacterium]|nr:flagellar biosynthetic protein FliR [Planctomycetota bacterium]
MQEATIEQWTFDALPPAAVLVGCRLLGLFISAPFFRSRLLPWRLKIAVVAVLSMGVLLSPVPQESLMGLGDGVLEDLRDPARGWLLIGGELLIGAVLGWSVLVVLACVQGAADLIAQQTGFTANLIADPQSQGGGSSLGIFYHGLAIYLLLSLNLHHSLIGSVLKSFSWVPPGSLSAASVAQMLGRLALEIGSDLFVAAMVLALPVLLAMVLVSMAQAALGRALPQAELFTLGLPVRLLVGLMVLYASLPVSMRYVGGMLRSAVRGGDGFLSGWSG